MDISLWPRKRERGRGRKTRHCSQHGEHGRVRGELATLYAATGLPGACLSPGTTVGQSRAPVPRRPQRHGDGQWKKHLVQRRISSIFHSFPHAKWERGGCGGREAGNLLEMLSYKEVAKRAGSKWPVPRGHVLAPLAPGKPRPRCRGVCWEEQKSRIPHTPPAPPHEWAAFTPGDINSSQRIAEEWRSAHGLAFGLLRCLHKAPSVRGCTRVCSHQLPSKGVNAACGRLACGGPAKQRD